LNLLKSISTAFSQWLQPFRRLAQTFANALKARQRQTLLVAQEAERIDRIRNPSKYRGK
jgi:hypothetical protein